MVFDGPVTSNVTLVLSACNVSEEAGFLGRSESDQRGTQYDVWPRLQRENKAFASFDNGSWFLEGRVLFCTDSIYWWMVLRADPLLSLFARMWI